MKPLSRTKRELINSLKLHPEFPRKVWVVVEQPRNERYRLAYDPVSGAFSKTAYKSLMYERGFSGVYGWIGGTGTPPEFHYDVMLLTKQDPKPGDVIEGYICGVFFRRDQDHKFVAMDEEFRNRVGEADLRALDKVTHDELMGLYPEVGENEGWYGAEVACNYLVNNTPVHD